MEKIITLDGVDFTVTTEGKVYRHDYIDSKGRKIKGKEIIPIKNTSGYLHFVHGHRTKGKHIRHMYFIHRLIATLFVDNPDPTTKICVDHIDGNKLNNSPDNLRWVTPKENMNNPITLAKLREHIKIIMSDPNVIEKMRHTINKNWSNPEYRKKYHHPRSEEARKRLRMSDKIWVHNDTERKFIYKEELQSYLDKGYVRGMHR